jgi:1-deoxy-D-xylulose-5-phosphate synthase
MRFVKPLDEALLHEIFSEFDKVITVEDAAIVGGFGSAILEFMAAHGYTASIHRLGIPDRIVEHGKPEELYRECGFDAAGIAAAAREMLKEKITVTA